jgi:hypothetical protein
MVFTKNNLDVKVVTLLEVHTFRLTNKKLVTYYIDYSDAGPSGIHMVIFRTQFLSGNRMVPTIKKKTRNRMVKVA